MGNLMMVEASSAFCLLGHGGHATFRLNVPTYINSTRNLALHESSFQEQYGIKKGTIVTCSEPMYYTHIGDHKGKEMVPNINDYLQQGLLKVPKQNSNFG